MRDASLKITVRDAVPAVCGAFVCSLSALVLIGWHLHIGWMVIGAPGSPPMVYSAALGLLGIGAGVLAAAANRPRLSITMSLLAVFIGAITLLEYALGTGHAVEMILESMTSDDGFPV